MKQIVILSGKGGTGKTSVTAGFAHLASRGNDTVSLVLADADVDAANLELVLKPNLLEDEIFYGGKLAIIDQNTCTACGDCQRICRFDAIREREAGRYQVDPVACDGCAACVYQCPTGSIHMEEQAAGVFFASSTRFGPLYHAHLHPGQENSGKLVTLVKQRARLQALDEGRELILIDGPPGIGCPVISAISGADLALIVTEPTLAGAHDLERILRTTQHFHVPALVCINKADLYPQGTGEIEAFCAGNGIEVLNHIPFDPTVTQAMVQGTPVTAYRPDAPASRSIAILWEQVIAHLSEEACPKPL
jgi:MinD superfamily P-loop ATPase